MAHATLSEVRQHTLARPGERRFAVGADPWSGPFVGIAGRDWGRFHVVDAGFAAYDWRSRVDVVREMAVAVHSGQMSIGQARQVQAFDDYIVDKVEFLARAAEYEGQPCRGDDEVALDICSQMDDDCDDLYQYDEVYAFEDDGHLLDAARALGSLPSWATVTVVGEGGPGTGYDQPYLLLTDGRGLEDLRVWLLNVPVSDADEESGISAAIDDLHDEER